MKNKSSSKTRMLDESDGSDIKSLNFLRKGLIEIIGVSYEEIAARIVKIHEDGFKEDLYIVRVVRNPRKKMNFHHCSCKYQLYQEKNEHLFFGEKLITITKECSHILALKHHPQYYLWIRNEGDIPIPKPNFKHYAKSEDLKFKVKKEMPLSQKELDDIDPFKHRKKIDMGDFIRKRKDY